MYTYTQCAACIRECPLNAAKDRVYGKRWPSDCFSCGRCLNVCPVDAIHYRPIVNPPIPRFRLGRLFK
ncbi:MAG: 4Fe-4S binding protein [Desulfosalsimonas sp.]